MSSVVLLSVTSELNDLCCFLERGVCVHRFLSKNETVESIEGLAYKNKKEEKLEAHVSLYHSPEKDISINHFQYSIHHQAVIGTKCFFFIFPEKKLQAPVSLWLLLIQ